MKLTAVKRYTVVCVVLGLLIIIVSSCKFSDDIKKDIHYTDFKFKGVVTFAPTQEPVNGVRVTFKEISSEGSVGKSPNDTVYTDAEGRYSIYRNIIFARNANFKLTFEPLKNIDYGVVDTVIAVGIDDFKGASGKYGGKAEKELNIGLKLRK